MNCDIERDFKNARNKLLNLNKSNKLLNYKEYNHTVEIDEISIEDLIGALVYEGKELGFVSNNSNLENVSAKQSIYTRCNLKSSLEENNLVFRLKELLRLSQTILDEKGLNVLYLSIGSLKWNKSENFTSPLLFIPVNIIQKGDGVSFVIKWTEEDIISNFVLAQELKNLNIEIPELNNTYNEDCIDNYFTQLEKLIEGQENWKINKQDILLDIFFELEDNLLYEDLNPRNWNNPIYEKEIIKAIYKPSTSNEKSALSYGEINKIASSELFHVLDSDSSQLAVIEEAKSGKNLVVEGPPGTGKSQTISNLIANILAQKKTVLFVSEKNTALEVVKNRLDQVDLGNFCLKIHDSNSKPKDVLNQIVKTLNYTTTTLSNYEKDSLNKIEEKANRLDEYKSSINNYIAELSTPSSGIGLSPFEIICIHENAIQSFSGLPSEIPILEDINVIDNASYLEARKSIEEVAETMKYDILPIRNNIWNSCNPPLIHVNDVPQISRKVDNILCLLGDLEKSIHSLISRDNGIPLKERPANLESLDSAISIATNICKYSHVNEITLYNDFWKKDHSQIYKSIEKIEQIQKYRAELKPLFTKEAYTSSNIFTCFMEYNKLSQLTPQARIVNQQYNTLEQKLVAYYKPSLREELNLMVPEQLNAKMCADIKKLHKYRGLIKSLKNNNNQGQNIFGPVWDGSRSNTLKLKDFSRWILTIHSLVNKGYLKEEMYERIIQGITVNSIKSSISNAKNCRKAYYDAWIEFSKEFGINDIQMFGSSIDLVEFGKIRTKLEQWSNDLANPQSSSIIPWSQFVFRKNSCKETIASPIIELVEKDLLKSNDLIHCFDANVANKLLSETFKNNPSLSKFNADEHQNQINKFKYLDLELIKANRNRVKNIILQNQPSLSNESSSTSKEGILKGQINRKNPSPIREIMESTGELIKQIVPCFMMSPISIAKYLPQNYIDFDIVVFDEASQVRPEYALGALLRGKQCVIVGDTKQLPPATYMQRFAIKEEDEVVAPITDMKSILDLGKRSLLSRNLLWHYRSKHESLIAFSNNRFYNNNLTFYPSPIRNPANFGLGVEHRYLSPEKYPYVTGKTGGNEEEAKKIISDVLSHFRNNRNKSLGIVAFNQRQRNLLIEEMDYQLSLDENSDIDEAIKTNSSEPIFIKSLEEVQGDERDVICVSCGFGFDINGKFSRKFGPLNNEGGDKRLNVLLTRSRERCIVYSNFKARDLGNVDSLSSGVMILREFLDYAESSGEVLNINNYNQDVNPIVESVRDFLQENGFEVYTNVGIAGYKVRLALLNEEKDQYFVGIEFDDRRYQSMKIASDRDRLCQQKLEEKGWNILRVWSVEWYNEPNKARHRLLDGIREIQNEIYDFDKS